MSQYEWPYRLWSCRCDGGLSRPGEPGGIEAWRALWREIQRHLKRHGFDPGPIDGVRGPRTDAAIVRFKAARGLRERDYVGELTMRALAGDPVRPEPAPVRADGPEPRWLVVARGYVGLKEVAGPHHHPEIVSWWRDIGAHWFDDDETPWCGAFVGGVLVEAGLAIPSAAEAPRARAWRAWGRPLRGPAVGALAVLWRGSPRGSSGHVGFVVGRDAHGRLMLLGGNQSDAVTVAPFDPDRVLDGGYRWPAGEPLPARVGHGGLPVLPARPLRTGR